jgi:hypothetical protein
MREMIDDLQGYRDRKRIADASERGRTEAVADVYDQIEDAARDARAKGQNAKARKLDDAADNLADALDEAEAAHAEGRKEDRDAAIQRARDAAKEIRDAADNLGDRVLRDVDGVAKRYQADDDRVPPMDRAEGRQKVADAMAEAQRKLRGEGREGRAKARDLRDDEESFEEAIEMAERAQDEKGREAYIATAQGVVDEVAQRDPELGAIMQEVLDGQAARIRAKGSGGGGDVPEVFSDSEGAVRIRGLADALRGGWNVAQIQENIRAGKVPGAKIVDTVGGGGNINGRLPVIEFDGKRFVLKYDNDEGFDTGEGASAEDNVGRMYRALGFNMPLVHKIEPESDDPHVRDVFLMEYTKEPGVFDGVNGVRMGEPYNQGTDGDGPRLTLEGLIANGIMGQSDRHGSNIMHGTAADGSRVPVFIDNGLMVFNATHGSFVNNKKPFKRNDEGTWLTHTPADMVGPHMRRERIGNPNSLRYGAQDLLKSMSRADGVSAITEFAERMRRTAESLDIDDDTRRFTMLRAQWVIDNADDVYDSILT